MTCVCGYDSKCISDSEIEKIPFFEVIVVTNNPGHETKLYICPKRSTVRAGEDENMEEENKKYISEFIALHDKKNSSPLADEKKEGCTILLPNMGGCYLTIGLILKILNTSKH